MYENKTVLITGGTGSWGHELTRQLLQKKVGKIIIFSRGELAQVEMKRKFSDERLHFRIGDVRDRYAVGDVMDGVNYVFHLAALKHVPVCEENPFEAIKTNIRGVENICSAAWMNGVEKVVDVSTDKAVDPINLYGMTKAVGERLMIHANTVAATKFICIRGGNAIGSNGSAIPLFISQIQQHNRVTLTDKRMTRYFMTLQEAVGLVFKGAEIGVGGEIFVMRMPAFHMTTIAQVLINEYGNKDTEIIETGIRPGEKLDEVLVSKNEARLTYKFDDDYYLIVPDTMQQLVRHYEHLEKVSFKEYSSSTELSDHKKSFETLVKSGFIKS